MRTDAACLKALAHFTKEGCLKWEKGRFSYNATFRGINLKLYASYGELCYLEISEQNKWEMLCLSEYPNEFRGLIDAVEESQPFTPLDAIRRELFYVSEPTTEE